MGHWTEDIVYFEGVSPTENYILMTVRERAALVRKMAEVIVENNIAAGRDFLYYDRESAVDQEENEFYIGSATLWGIRKNSDLYSILLEWYGSEEVMRLGIRMNMDIDMGEEYGDWLMFVTGKGYNPWSAYLLGGTVSGDAYKKFEEFMENRNKGERDKRISERSGDYNEVPKNFGSGWAVGDEYDWGPPVGNEIW